MWAGSTASEAAGQLGGVRASSHAGYGETASTFPAAAAAAPPPAMPYPWDHHHLRHQHEEVAVSARLFFQLVSSAGHSTNRRCAKFSDQKKSTLSHLCSRAAVDT